MSRHFHITLIGLMIALSGLPACKSSKNVEGGKTSSPAVRDAEKLYGELSQREMFQYYSGKARLKARTPDARMSATLNLRIVRDSVVWATIDKLGFEVARVLIRPDSVFIVDRLNKEYSVNAFGAFLSEYNIELGFGDLQQVLIGNMIALEPVNLEYARESQCDVFLVRDASGISARYCISQSKPARLISSHFVDVLGRSLQIENLDWNRQRGDLLPYGRYVVFADEDGATEIELSFQEIITNKPASLPFSIPGHYAKVR